MLFAQSTALVAPFDFSRGAIGVNVSVTGTPLFMILDTGVDPSVIDLKLAESLHLKVDRENSGEADGFGEGKGASVFPTSVSGLAIRGHAFAPFDALASDTSRISASFGRRLDGILGYSFLSDKVILIDYPEQKLGISRRKAEASRLTRGCRKHWSVPLKTVDSFPIIPDFRLGNITAPVSLDTGSNGTIGLFRSALDLPAVRNSLTETGTIRHTGARGDANAASYTFGQPVGFGPFVLPPGQTMTLHSEAGSRESRVANIGNALFAAMKLKLLLDYRSKVITFYGNCQ
jgi:hypothetical protein